MDALNHLIRLGCEEMKIAHDNRVTPIKRTDFQPANKTAFPSIKLKCVKMEYFIQVLRDICFKFNDSPLLQYT